MATKIGFRAEPLIESGGIDWLSVGRDVVKTLGDQETERQKTRDQADKAYSENQKTLNYKNDHLLTSIIFVSFLFQVQFLLNLTAKFEPLFFNHRLDVEPLETHSYCAHRDT